jgi:Zn-dependent peptidase ImmA (M78 family)
MTLPHIDPLVLWRKPANLQAAIGHLMAIIDANDHFSRQALANDPIGAISDSEAVKLISTNVPESDCGLFGSYDSAGPTIRYNKSATAERDNFTVLHELGHHLQRNDSEWAFGILARMTAFERRLLEEEVCDGFASQILIPDSLVAELGATIDSAYVAKLFQRSKASRRAAVMRTIAISGESPLLLAIVDVSGAVQFSASTSDDLFQLPSRSIQPDLASLFRNAGARGSTVRSTAKQGVRYSSGQSRSDVTIDVTVDNSGIYAFAAIKPTYPFGDKAWASEERLCNSDACGEEFTWNAEVKACSLCSEPKCPNCETCGCEKAPAVQCMNCFMELSLADIAGGRDAHDDC